MTAPTSKFWLVALVAAVVATSLVLSSQTARSFPADERPKWEYVTVSTEASSLQARLTELGDQGWEVFSIDRADMAVEQGVDGNAHVVVSRYEVTAKRPAR